MFDFSLNLKVKVNQLLNNESWCNFTSKNIESFLKCCDYRAIFFIEKLDVHLLPPKARIEQWGHLHGRK